MPSVSILLPTYNGELYLAEQLDSILTQTFRDFELLIVDDGSTDRTRDILADYAQRDDRIRTIPSEGNRGQKQRLIELFEAARAPLIGISDQDDVWDPRKLEYLTASLRDAALSFGRSELIDGAGRSLGRTLLDANRARRRPGDRLSILFRPQVSGHAMLARREIITPAIFRSREPYDWLVSIIAEFSAGITYNDHAIVLHRLHGANFHNSAVLLRMNPMLVRPRHVAQAVRRASARKFRFLEGLGFLAGSTFVPEREQAIFRSVAAECRAAWIEKGSTKPVPGRRLRRTILNLLQPLAGSAGDWQTAVDHVTAMTLGLFHPLNIIRLRRLL